MDEVGSIVAKRMHELEVKVAKANWRKAGAAVAPIAAAAAVADLGIGGGFSGWRRSASIRLQAKATVHPDGEGVTIHRDRVSAGPWAVAELGRNQGNASGFSGPGINRKTGVTARTKLGKVRKVRATGAKRWNGTTVGKGTWTDAERLMAPKAKAEMNRLFVDDVVKAFENPL